MPYQPRISHKQMERNNRPTPLHLQFSLNWWEHPPERPFLYPYFHGKKHGKPWEKPGVPQIFPKRRKKNTPSPGLAGGRKPWLLQPVRSPPVHWVLPEVQYAGNKKNIIYIYNMCDVCIYLHICICYICINVYDICICTCTCTYICMYIYRGIQIFHLET